VIDRWRTSDRLMSVLFDLHAHLMAGDAGERVAGVVGLLRVSLAASGPGLWWSARRAFSFRNTLLRDFSRRSLLVWHRELGAVTSPVLLILLLTGSGLVFYETARTLLNGIFGNAVPAVAEAGSAAEHQRPRHLYTEAPLPPGRAALTAGDGCVPATPRVSSDA
jgi:uncharacterized iron-regulated membrane protein